MITVLILSACGPDVPAGSGQLPDLQVGESPTLVVDATAATQSTELERPFVPVTASFDIRLTAVRSGAKIIRSGGNELEVQQDQMVDVQVDDGIEVVKLEGQDEQSYSILDFADYLEVELFSNTSVFLADLRQAAAGSTHVTLHLEGGHMFVHLGEQTTATVQTPFATIRILAAGTEFDVCHNEALSCVFVKRGVVEVITQNRSEFVTAGEASQILRDQHPSPPICAPISRFTTWEDSYRQFADTQSLEKEISELPQESCALTATGIPVHARVLYQDEFRNPFSGWDRGKIDNFIVRYAGLQYYRVQAQASDNQFFAFTPDEGEYGDMNVDLRAIGEAASGGDFRYGLVFRRSGDQYYAFIVSPVKKSWYFLKSSSTGLEILKDGTDERMRGLDAKETLRVEAYGSTFLVFINGRFIDLVSDPDYASGEVGLFFETVDSPDAFIRFDWIVIWDVPPAVPDLIEGGREYCFNTWDDDGDRLIDRSDPDCQRSPLTSTPQSLPTNTSIVPNTSTPQPTNTSIVPNTSTPQPTATSISPTPGPTRTRVPTRTRTPIPNTLTPIPNTLTPIPNTLTPVPPTNPPTVQPTEPEPTEPQPTEPQPTEPQPTEPQPTEPQPTEPPVPTEPPTP